MRPAMRAIDWVLYAKRTLVTGCAASLAGLAALLAVSRCETGSPVAALNGSSQLVHGDEALRERRVRVRMLVPALLIHHASAHWWAAVHEHPAVVARLRRPMLRAGAVMAFAAILDYGLLPRRLSPGYEGQLSRGGIALVFGALAGGLALGSWMQRPLRRLDARIADRLRPAQLQARKFQ